MAFLPITKKDMETQGIEQLDFVYVIGDAYVDHPSFGHAIISRVLESRGYKVALRKFDPYLNYGPGTMSPLQHGEIFVTADGNYCGTIQISCRKI